MRRLILPVLALALAAAPAQLDARQPRSGPHWGGAGGDPVQRILEQRDALGLTGAQVQRLEAIRADLDARSAPLLEELRTLRAGTGQARRPELTPEQREALRERMQTRTERLAPEQREALRERMKVRTGRPTPEQRDALRERMQARTERLTPEQREALRERIQTRTERLAPEQRDALRERIQVRTEQLTPEQRETLRERIQARPGGAAGGAFGRRGAFLQRGGGEHAQIVRQLAEHRRAAFAEIRAVLSDAQFEQLRGAQRRGPGR